MGCENSKTLNKSKRISRSERVLTMIPDDSDITVDSAIKQDEDAVKILKLELENSPQTFILNNILLSVMFFENYKQDMQKLIHSTTTRMEKELNPKLLRDEIIECIIPDIIIEKVYKNVRFRPLHGPKKYSSEPLVPKRIYVVNDNIEVYNAMDIQPHYSVIDKPGYQVRVEDSNRAGFVKLRLLDLPKALNDDSLTSSNIKKLSEPIPGPSTRDDDSDIYDYTTITAIKTPKPLDVINCERRDTLPKTCFAIRKIKKIHNIDDSDSDSDSSIEETEDDLYENISYISSQGFMTYIQNAVFPNSLGRALGFDNHEINLAKAMPGTIFCNLLDEETNLVPCEIIPSVALNWPSMQAFEFEMREERPTITDKIRRLRYRWPTDEMIGDIKTLTCVLVPKGCFEKRGTNTDNEIEWEINFPKAERYLETRMSHEQIRCFLCLLALYRTYIEPVTAKYGLLPEHIRCHMYWECETNFRDWPEHRLGTKIIKVMENLNSRLSKSHLPDYFIKQKNLFENIPKKYLRFAHKTIHNVLETPAMYFLGALRNLRYTNSKFYPPLDFKELHTILTTDGIKYVNANLLTEIPRRVPVYRRKRNQDPEVYWMHKKEMIIKEKIIKKRMKEKEKEQEENPNESRKDSVDSINYEWSCDRGFGPFKTRSVLIFFIKHFLEIARKSLRISTTKQTLFYLKQAYYLGKILEDTDGGVLDAREFLEIIAKEEESCKKVAVIESSDYPPSTPIRNSNQFSWELTQQVKSNNINLSNLNKSYNINGVIPNGVNKVKRNPSNLKKSIIRRLSNEERSPLESRKSVVFVETVEKLSS